MKCPKCGKRHWRRLKGGLCLQCSPPNYVNAPDVCTCEFVKCERVTVGHCSVHPNNLTTHR